MTFWGAVMWFLIGAAVASAPWAYFYGRLINQLADARLDLRKVEDLFKTRLREFMSRPLPPPSKSDADALLEESERALGEGMQLSDDDEKSADREGLK